MLRLLLLFSVLLVSSFLVASLVHADRVVIGRPVEVTHPWKNIGPSDPAQPLRLHFALKDRNIQELAEYALQISDPSNRKMWGKQLSYEEIVERTTPSSEEIEGLVAYLEGEGVESVSVGRGRSFVTVTADLKTFERILDCKFHRFQHRDSRVASEVVDRCVRQSTLPSAFADLVVAVEPVHAFAATTPSLLRARKQFKPAEEKVGPVNITRILDLYNVTLGKENLKVNNSQAVFEFEDNFNPQDLQQFFQKYTPQLEGQTVLGILGNGKNHPNSPGGEASLDVQLIMSAGAYAPTYYYTYTNSKGDIFQGFLDYTTDLDNDPAPPLVHSISYGAYGGKYPIAIVDKVSNNFMKLGTRGVTILVASGDDGAGCNNACNQDEFPYPSSPWVTLLGSTFLSYFHTSEIIEVGASFSSGGFSDDFGVTDWQKDVVDIYLKSNGTPPASFFNASGRGLPDVSTIGVDIKIVVGGEVVSVGGTSCSAPTFGGLVSLMNGERLKAGKKPLGFINPTLYQGYAKNNAYYNDIVNGQNTLGSCCPGFHAVKGWDAVTGLGTPNFGLLWSDYIANLP